MCKFNGKSIEVRTINGETVYHGRQTLLAIGYGNYSNLLPKTCSILGPSECIQIPYGKSGMFHEYWITRAGLNKLAAINAQAPAHCSHTTNWGNFLRQLDGESLTSESTSNEFNGIAFEKQQIPPLFTKIDNLIEEYQEFRDQYMKMQEELRRLEAENARLKRNFAKAREVFTECAAGF